MIIEITIADFTSLANNPLSFLVRADAQKPFTQDERSKLSGIIHKFITENYAILFEAQNQKAAQASLEKLRVFSVYQHLDRLLVNTIDQLLESMQGSLLRYGCFRIEQKLSGYELEWRLQSPSGDDCKAMDKFFSNAEDAPIAFLDFRKAHDLLKDGEIAALMSRNPNIKGITFKENTSLTDKGIKQIVKYGKNLESLAFSTFYFTDHWLQKLSQCPRLHSLTLEKCSGLTTAGFSYLPQIASLSVLRLDNVSEINDRALGFISQLSNLSELSLKNLPKFYDYGKDFFSELKILKKLELVSLYISNSNLGGLSNLAYLTYLNLSNCELLTEDSLQWIRKNNGLLHLDISRTAIGKYKGLNRLRNCRALKYLNISYCQNFGQDVRFSPLEPLHALTSLTTLCLDGLKNIQPLDIHTLAEKCANLELISVNEGCQPNDELLQKLKKLRPKLRIEYDSENSCPVM